MDNLLYVKRIPKVELHAHLNGSLSTESIKQLAEEVYGTNAPAIHRLCEQLVDFDSLEKCFLKFPLMHELTSTKKGLQLATKLAIRDFAKDNVIYLELRTTPKRTVEMSKRDYMMNVLETIQSSMKMENILVRLLPSIDRSQSVAEAMDTVNLALELRCKYEGLITGIDFSGNPKVGKFEDFMPALAKARQGGLKMAIHCAEINNPSEIDQMIEFGMDRCGHGTFLNEEQLKALGRKKIPIECCLTSNVKCGTVKSYQDHHFKRILESSVTPVVLCTDDCGVFNTTLSQEFALAQQSYNLTESELNDLLRNAVKFAFIEPREVEPLLREVDRQLFKINGIKELEKTLV